MEHLHQLTAVSGIASYMSPLHMLSSALVDPINTLSYIAFTVTVCAIFPKTWIGESGSGSRVIAEQLKNPQMISVPSRPCQWYL